jgi:hypothetical protein
MVVLSCGVSRVPSQEDPEEPNQPILLLFRQVVTAMLCVRGRHLGLQRMTIPREAVPQS